MKKRNLFFFLLFVASAVGLAVYDYLSGQHKEEAKAQSARLYNNSLVDVVSFQILNPKASFIVRREGEGWLIEGQSKDSANPKIVESFIEVVLNEKSKELIEADESSMSATYGFDQPQGTLQINFQSGQTTSYVVGSRKNFQGDSFLKRGAKEVLVGSPIWLDHVKKVENDLRDLRLMRGDIAKVNSIEVEIKSADPVKLEKVDGVWRIKQGLEFVLDQNAVRDFIANFKDISAIEVLSEGRANEEQVKALELKNPKMIVSFFGEGAVEPFYKASVFVSKNNIHSLQSSETDLLLKISPTDSEDLQASVARGFYDRNIPFRFDVSAVKKVTLQEDSSQLSLIFDGSKWSFEQKVEGLELVEDILSQSLTRISSLEFSSIENEKKLKSSATKTIKVVELFGANGNLLRKLEFRNRQGPNKAVAIKVEGYPQIFEISSEQFDNLNLNLWTKNSASKN